MLCYDRSHMQQISGLQYLALCPDPPAKRKSRSGKIALQFGRGGGGGGGGERT